MRFLPPTVAIPEQPLFSAAARRQWLPGAVLFFLATLAIGVAGFFALGLEKPLDADGPYYVEIGRQLAAGNGYTTTLDPWPQYADYNRMPGWPVMLAPLFWLFPSASPDLAGRLACLVVLALVAGLYYVLGWRLSGSKLVATCSAIGVSSSAVLYGLAFDAMSEPPFLLWIGLSALAFSYGLRGAPLGGLLLGVAILIRANMQAGPVLFVALLLAVPAGRALLREHWQDRRVWAALVLTALLPGLWMVRSYRAFGEFTLSYCEGESLFGSYNQKTVEELGDWGYWIFPDFVPGVEPKRSLAARMNPKQMNDHYKALGRQYIQSHLPLLPRTVLGRWIRGFSVVPWKGNLIGWVSLPPRLVGFGLVLLLAGYWWRKTPTAYLVFFAILFLTNAVTITLYFGMPRITVVLVDVFLWPLIGIGLQQWLADRQGFSGDRGLVAEGRSEMAGEGESAPVADPLSQH